MRTKLLLALTLIVVFSLNCHIYQIAGSGNPVTDSYKVDNFESVVFSYGCEATFEQADSFSVEVTIDDNLEKYVIVEKRDRKLIIGLETGNSYRTTLFTARVKAPFFQSVGASGGSTVEALDTIVFPDPFEINLSGGSEMSASAFTGDLNVLLSGGSRLTLDGAGEDLSLNVSGGGEARMFAFEVNDCSAVLSGGSEADISTSGVINAQLSGGSDLDYCGDATLGSVQRSGGATIHNRCP